MTSTTKPSAKSSTPATATPIVKPSNIKKVKVAPGSQIKAISAAISANKEAAASAVKSPISLEKLCALEDKSPRPQVSIKKAPELPDVIDFDIFPADPIPLKPKEQKPHETSVRRLEALGRGSNNPDRAPKLRPVPEQGAAPATPSKKITAAADRQLGSLDFEQRLSLQRMKDDAVSIVKQRRNALTKARKQIAGAYRATSVEEVKVALKSSLDALKTQVEAVDNDLRKLELFGLGSKTLEIKGVDKEAIVALSSWGFAVDKHLKSNGAASKEVAPFEGITEDDLVAEEDRFNIEEVEASSSPNTDGNETLLNPASPGTEFIEPSPKPFQPPAAPAFKPAPRGRPAAPSALQKPKRNSPNSAISRPSLTTLQVDVNKSKETNIIGIEEASRAEAVSRAAEKKQTSKGRKKGFSSKGATQDPKPRIRMDADGNLKFRKKGLSVAGEKRKRGDVMEQPNKRSAVEGRNFAPLRTRRAAPTSDAMDIDSPAPFLAASYSFSM